MNSQDTVMICFIQYSCKCNNMAVACHQEVICDLLISFLKLYFGQIAAVSYKSDYLTSRLATFFFHNTAASASIPNIYSKDTWRQSMNLEFIMIGQLVIVKVTLPICIIQPVLNYSYLVYHCCRVQVCVMLLNKKNSVDPSFQLPMDVKQYFY